MSSPLVFTFDSNFAGLVFATEEGKAIAKCLGDKKAALLGNHGLLTAGPSIEAAVAWFVLLEKLCEIQLAADASAAGTGKPLIQIGHEEAASTHYAIGRPEGGYCKFSQSLVKVFIMHTETDCHQSRG